MPPEFNMPYGPKTPIQPLPLTSVQIRDKFWRPRMDTNRTITIWHEIEECEKTGRLANFEAAVGKGKHGGSYIFNDSDVYKVIEAAGYILGEKRDAKLEAKIDAWIDLIAAAQEPDGYLCTTVTASKFGAKKVERWDRHMHEHETYNVGHMYEGAVAYWKATGKRKLLDVSIKSADLICSVFNPKGLAQPPGHQEIEIGLVRLYEATGNRKYLEQAKWFLDARGARGGGNWGEYNQDHARVLEQDRAVGHSVRAAYMYAGMVDVGTHVGDAKLVEASARVWQDVVKSKIYLTGGIGSSGSNEGFAGEYNLPNLNGYAETCATIASVFWNQRLFLATGDAKYLDILERGLYNAFLSGYGLDGKSFFYPNPLQSVGGAQRPGWFACACCPPNVSRLIATLPYYMYAQDKEGLFVNLYCENEAKVSLGGNAVKLTQKTNFPWDGKIELKVEPTKAATFAVRLRIPGWARGEVFPSPLYASTKLHPFEVKVNGKVQKVALTNGFAVLKRTWKAGDRVELDLPLEPLWLECEPRVADNVGRLAIQRGPIVYCAEFADQADRTVLDRVVAKGDRVLAKWHDDLGGYVGLTTDSRYAQRVDGQVKTAKEEVPLKLIPYYAWAHRGQGQMAVWLASDPKVAWPAPEKTIVFMSKVSSSGGERIGALRDQLEPKTSNDHSVPFFHWWPKKGTTEWVEFAFDKPQEISEVSVYWFEDEGIGECRLPKAWRAFYRDGEAWKPVETSNYPILKDAYSKLGFKKVATSGFRIEVDQPARFATGMHEVVIR